ncbi:MAG: hypothetical protein HF308_17125 [Ignavibacteria bacterium]|jgi:hypothetical protein|nr:hypothetical protein [Ignavibacteria bacterium]
MASNLTLLNTIWDNGSTHYQDRVPQATRDNITAVGNAILQYESTKNEFLDALVNRISLVLVSSKMAKNKLSQFKGGMIEYGSDIEEIYTAMAQAQVFDVAKAESEVFKRKKPDVKSIFHRVNRQDVYKTTIEEGQIKRAFLSNDGLGKLVASIVNSLYSGDVYDEYILTKELVAKYYQDDENGKTAVIDVAKVTDQESAMNFFRTIKQASKDMTYMNTAFNPMGVQQFTEQSDQVLLLHKNVATHLDTDVLAWVFNEGKMDYAGKVIEVDDFGSLGNTQGVLVDKNWFRIFDKLYETRNLYNPEGLYWNYWLHHHQLLSYSLFHQAVRFTDITPA